MAVWSSRQETLRPCAGTNSWSGHYGNGYGHRQDFLGGGENVPEPFSSNGCFSGSTVLALSKYATICATRFNILKFHILHCVFHMVFSQQTATLSLNSIYRLGFVAETSCVFPVRCELNVYVLCRRNSALKGLILYFRLFLRIALEQWFSNCSWTHPKIELYISGRPFWYRDVQNICGWSYNISVAIATGCWIDGPESIPGKRKIFFFTAQRQDRLWGPPSLQSNGHRGLFPQGETDGGVKLAYSPTASTEVKNTLAFWRGA
jgi:hypothetical protein